MKAYSIRWPGPITPSLSKKCSLNITEKNGFTLLVYSSAEVLIKNKGVPLKHLFQSNKKNNNKAHSFFQILSSYLIVQQFFFKTKVHRVKRSSSTWSFDFVWVHVKVLLLFFFIIIIYLGFLFSWLSCLQSGVSNPWSGAFVFNHTEK